MTLSDITIIIVSFKSAKKVKECLDSINNKSKTIVIENSSDQSLKNNLEKQYSNVECILANKNLGYGRGNNLALKKVRTKFALILNPDTKIENNTLEEFLKVASKIKDFAIIGPQLYQGLKVNKNSNEPYEVENLKGFALFLNLVKFDKIKYFDENFFLYFEEIDLCKRIKKIGEKIYIAPQVRILHDGAQSVDDYFNQEVELTRNWHWMWSTFYFHKKHKNYIYALIIVMPKLFSSLFKVIFFSLLMNKQKRDIYNQRLSGLVSAILCRNSWYRPPLD
jgi:N-acetylglucosaminyl-diphospho-decaprenol L-rhamnosyltransferase